MLTYKASTVDPKDVLITPAASTLTPIPTSLEHWTPIDIHINQHSNDDTVVELCQLDWKKYSKSPHLSAMFKQLVASSNCEGSNLKSLSLAEIKKQFKLEVASGKLTSLTPAGFVFHESRVGSTLVANLLGSNPSTLQFSESTPPGVALLNCHGCSRQRSIELFHDIIMLMGHTTSHKQMFFKFNSISTTAIDIALMAFPNTPWAFVYRSPVQTMMSHLDPRKGGGEGSPCLRAKKKRMTAVNKIKYM